MATSFMYTIMKYLLTPKVKSAKFPCTLYFIAFYHDFDFVFVSYQCPCSTHAGYIRIDRSLVMGTQFLILMADS